MDNFDLKKYLTEGNLLKEEQYSSDRVNARDGQAADKEITNHYFDTVDMVELKDGYTVQITSTYFFRDPGVAGYSDTLSEENPRIMEVKTVLMDPSGKAIKNHNFTGSGQWWMLQSGKDKFIPYIIEWWTGKLEKM